MSNDLSGFSMHELFRAEAETHCAALSSGLLAIEANPADVSQVAALMRAAHSIKGAARILGLDPVVHLAHAMEDCFVAVQQGHESLTPTRVDQLLKGVDLLERIAQLPEKGVPAWLASETATIDQLASALRQPVGQPAADQPPAAPPAAPETGASGSAAATHEGIAPPAEPRAAVAPQCSTPATPPVPTDGPPESAPDGPPAVAPEAAAEADQRTVRVNAANLNRIMRLASESMIESRRIRSLGSRLGESERRQRKILALLDEIDHRQGAASEPDVDLPAVRALSQQSEQLLRERLGRLERVSWRAEELSTALYHEVIASRMRPFVEGTTAFPRMIRDLSRALGKRVALKVLGPSVPVDRDILRDLEAPLNHLLRNGVDHGIETPDERRAAGKSATGHIVLEARHLAGMLTVRVQDDGRGIDREALRQRVVDRGLADASLAASLQDAELMEFLFLPGFSTADRVTEVSGRGVGLDVVRSMVQQVSGTVRAESVPGSGTVFTLHLPVTLSVIRAALAEIGGELYAFPLSRLTRVQRVSAAAIRPVQGRQQFLLDGQSVGLVSAAEILDLAPASAVGEDLSVIVVGQDGWSCGLAVDRFVGEQDIVVRPLDRRLGKVPHVAAAAVTEQGDPLLIVDVEDLLQSMRQLLGEGRLRGLAAAASEGAAPSRLRVLVVDDSITVREVQRHLLAGHGYDVDVAVDGQDGWHALQATHYDLLDHRY